jgi:hypothetical protein
VKEGFVKGRLAKGRGWGIRRVSGPLPSHDTDLGYYQAGHWWITRHELYGNALRQKGMKRRAETSQSKVPPSKSRVWQHLTWLHTRRDERGGYLERIKLRTTSAGN